MLDDKTLLGQRNATWIENGLPLGKTSRNVS
jgi:hypothetical protein